jgi:hypothetical protein
MKAKYYVPLLVLALAAWLWAQGPKNAVRSVFGRTGDVTALAGDYNFAKISGQITPSQMPTNWWLLIPPETMCQQCPDLKTPGTLQTGVGSAVASNFTLWDGVSQAPIISVGPGSPEGVVTAVPGSLRIRTNPGLLYVKQSGTGNTGWIQK